MDLGAKHNCSESEKQKTLKAQEDHQDHSYRWGEVTAFCENDICSYKKTFKKSIEHVHTETSPLQKTAVKAKYLMLEMTSHNYNKLLISSTAAALFAAQGNKEF